MITTSEFKDVLDNAVLIRKELPQCEMTLTEVAVLIVTLEIEKTLKREALKALAPRRVNVNRV